MKCMSIKQPYCDLLSYTTPAGRRVKMYETRKQKTNYRGPVLIYSPDDPLFLPGINQLVTATLGPRHIYETGKILYTGVITDCIEITDDFINSLPMAERAAGLNLFPGNYALKIDHICPLQNPYRPAKIYPSLLFDV